MNSNKLFLTKSNYDGNALFFKITFPTLAYKYNGSASNHRLQNIQSKYDKKLSEIYKGKNKMNKYFRKNNSYSEEMNQNGISQCTISEV